MPSAHDTLRQAAIEAVVAVNRYVECDERPRSQVLWQRMTSAVDNLAEVANVYPLKGETADASTG